METLFSDADPPSPPPPSQTTPSSSPSSPTPHSPLPPSSRSTLQSSTPSPPSPPLTSGSTIPSLYQFPMAAATAEEEQECRVYVAGSDSATTSTTSGSCMATTDTANQLAVGADLIRSDPLDSHTIGSAPQHDGTIPSQPADAEVVYEQGVGLEHESFEPAQSRMVGSEAKHSENVVWQLFEITRRFKDLTVHVCDSEGEFLLIESLSISQNNAAFHLPLTLSGAGLADRADGPSTWGGLLTWFLHECHLGDRIICLDMLLQLYMCGVTAVTYACVMPSTYVRGNF
ncbi:hypothetical protein Drorol1_Dr00003744 [Drosera rotundifolia]